MEDRDGNNSVNEPTAKERRRPLYMTIDEKQCHVHYFTI